MVAKRVFYSVVFVATLLVYVYIYTPNLKAQKPSLLPETQIKYILLWNNPRLAPLNFLGHGFDAFIVNGCEYTNCYATDNSSVLRSVVDYDAVVFNGRYLPRYLPQARSEKQKYVYANMESSHNYPVCSDRFESFFNWTWTYKLDSDSKWGYFTIYDLTGHVVGPKINMHWSDMDPVDNNTKELLITKNIAAAWFVSNCNSKSRRESIGKAIAKELLRLDLSLDVYGKCGTLDCSREYSAECNERLQKDYYFYFSFENSFSEDYVTEKVLTALLHWTVPVVFGEANYSRFLPPGSYLDARELGPRRLARRIAAIIRDHETGGSIYHDFFRFLPPGSYLDARELGPRRLARRIAAIIRDHETGGSIYHDFFRWRNHYVYKDTSQKEDVCKICKLLNDPVAVYTKTTYGHFRRWWNSESSVCRGGH